MTTEDLHNFSLSEILNSDAERHTDDFKVLRRLAIPEQINQVESPIVKIGLVVDVESTGLSLEDDEVVQLGMLPFSYDAVSGKILSVHKSQAFVNLREASVPMSKEASLITGITDENLTGKKIDQAEVERIVAGADVIIAHNAAFDRPMVEKVWQCFEAKPWACTLSDVDWLSEGFAAGKLDYLGMQFGWFYDGHDALTDCEACLALLTRSLPKTGQLVMNVLRASAQQQKHLIRAIGADFEKKEQLKRRRYHWRGQDAQFGKFWWTITGDLAGESAWLQDEIYSDKRAINSSVVPATMRFSNRVWELR
jgi:DNA polymerase-3 subunit epsilon